LLYITIIKTVQ